MIVDANVIISMSKSSLSKDFFGKFDRIELVSSWAVSTTRRVSSITILPLTIASLQKDVKRHFDVYIDIWLLFVFLSVLREFRVLNGDSLNIFEMKEISNFEKWTFVCTLFHLGVFLCILSMYNWVICEFWIVFRTCKFCFSKSVEAKCVSA